MLSSSTVAGKIKLNLQAPIMLKTIPVDWFSWNCHVVKDQIPIANLGFSVWGEAGELQIQDQLYKVFREDNGNFFLANQETCIAFAEKPNPLFRQFFIRHADTRYELQALSAKGRQFIVQEYGQIVGSIYPAHGWSKRAIADLPDAIPLPLRLFMIWLVLTLWKRQQQR
jgi:hypothetical protein